MKISFLPSLLFRVTQICVLFLLAIVLVGSTATAQLHGTYTIGSGGNYSNFGAAVTALTSSGVSAAVTFNVLPGTYTEHIVLPSITGASASNTILFQASTHNATDVTLAYASGSPDSNYIVKISGGNYFHFRKMTFQTNSVSGASYCRAFDLNGGWDHLTIDSCALYSATSTSNDQQAIVVTTTASAATDFVVNANTFANGGYGILLSGISNGSRLAGVKITNNTFVNNYYAVSLITTDAPVISGNSVSGFGAYGFYINGTVNNFQVLKNKLISGGNVIGIYFIYSAGGSGFPFPAGLVANNFVYLTAPSATGIYLYGTTYANIYYNSVNLTGIGSSSCGLNISGSTGNSNNIVNNIFSSPGGGYPYSFSSAADIGTSDYNDLYTTHNFIVYYNGQYVPTLASLQGMGKETHSVAYNPLYVSASDLHAQSAWVNGKGTTLAEVTTDIDGEARNGSTPDIGADEYTPPAGTTPPLSGAYTVGGGGAYATVAAAVSDLLIKGVSGPVTFNLLNGNFNEHSVITPVSGASPTNTITFESSTNNAANVNWFFIATLPESNYVAKIQGAKYLRFHKLSMRSNNNSGASYSRVIDMSGGWDFLTVDTCIFNGVAGGSSDQQALIITSTGSTCTSCNIYGNTFTNGGYGVDIGGYSGTYRCSGIQINNNTFTTNYYAVAVSNGDSPGMAGNIINNCSAYGIYLYSCINNFMVIKNKIASTGGIVGIYLYADVGGSGFPNNPGLVANNFIAATSAGGSNGIYLYGTTNCNIYNNSVNMSAVTTNSYALYISGSSGNTNNVVNNIFSNPGGGYALYVSSSTDVGTIDYNNYFSPFNFLAYWSGQYPKDLVALEGVSGKDASSTSYNPMYVTTSDLHARSPWINGKGTVLSDVSDDIDGQARDGSTPDIGADEFTPAVGTTTPMAGTYTIGTSGNYTTFNAAVTDLLIKGISAPVTFNVLNGNYPEHIVLTNISGSSPTNTITFQSNGNNAAGVTWYFIAAVPESNYVVKIVGAKNIKFHKLGMRSSNTSGASYARIIDLNNGWDNVVIDSCILTGAPTTSGDPQALVITTTGSTCTNFVANGNTFANGGYGIDFGGYNASNRGSGVQITNNTFTLNYNSVYVGTCDAPLVSGNTFTNTSSTAINLTSCSNYFQIVKNKIVSNNSITGVYCYGSAGGTGFPNNPGLVANNFTAISGPNSSIGLYLYATTYCEVYNNSINMTGNSANTVALQIYGSTGNTNNIVNNIFSNPGGGYAYYVGSNNDIATIDYNDLYTTGIFLAVWNNNYPATLSALQTLTGKDASSHDYNPVFTSATDLHTKSPWLNGKGTSLAEVFDDIDGEARDGSTPDIGADEYTPTAGTTTPLAGSYTIGSGGNYTTFNAASSDLTLKGVSAPVTFNVLNGNYTEHLVLTTAPGMSPVNTVTFQANSGTASSTVWSFSASAPESNYVVKLLGGKYFKFRKLSFLSNTTSGAAYSQIFSLNGGWDYFSLDSSYLTGAINTSGTAQGLVVTSTNCYNSSCSITNNTFANGGYGVDIVGYNSTYLAQGVIVANNLFINQYYGIYIYNAFAPLVSGNTVKNFVANGIETDYCYGASQVIKNSVTTNAGSTGMVCTGVTGGTGFPTPRAIVANNVIAMGANNSPYGMNLNSCTNLFACYNTVNITSPSGSSIACYVYGGGTNPIKIVNNIFANPGSGYTLYLQTPTNVDTLDNNDYVTSGTNLAYVNGNVANLAALKTATGKDIASISVDPAFFSTVNLHTLSSSIDSAGVPLYIVTDDFDGKTRDANKPDIGAYEFSQVVTYTQAIQNAWNLLSLPLTVVDAHASVLYPTAGSKAFGYSGGYVVRDSLVNKYGYWIRYNGPATAPISGKPRLRDTIAVSSGWNLIGSIAYPVGKASIIQSPVGIIDSKIFAYDAASGYVISDTVKPSAGYWVHTTASGSLQLDVHNTANTPGTAAKAAKGLDLTELNSIQIERNLAGGTATKLYFTADADLREAAAEYILPPVPPSEAYDARFATNRSVELFDGTADREVPIAIQGTSGSMRLSWKLTETGLVSYVLVERTNGAVTAQHPLTATGTLTISSGANKSYALKANPLPAVFALRQNYPNPFNPTTKVEFILPQQSPVTLKIYNVLGAEVATLIDHQTMDRGLHAVEVDAHAWVSGVYFYRLIAGSFNDMKKMMLVK